MSKELLTELKHKKEVYKKWKQGQMTQEEHRVALWSCSNRVKKAKADLELNLARNVTGNKEGFYSYVSNSIRKTEREKRWAP